MKYRNTHAMYFVTYQYTFEGRRFTSEQMVSKKHYEQWDLHMPVLVRLLPNEPSVADMVDDAIERRGMPWGLVVAIFGLLFFVVGFLGGLAQLITMLVLHQTP